MSEHQAAYDPRGRYSRQPRDHWKWLRSLYHRWLYRAHMRFAHRFHWHHTRSNVMSDGTVHTRCDWCGLTQVCSYELAKMQGFVKP